MNHSPVPPHRRPLVIDRGRIEAGDHATAIRSGQPDDLLRQYLRLVRRARRQWRHRNIAVRRADIVTLAGHLGWSEEQVLIELAELAGASTRQRAAMLAVLATGASLITISGPAAAAPPPAVAPATPYVVTVPVGMYTGTGPATAPIEAVEAPTTPGSKSSSGAAARSSSTGMVPGVSGKGTAFPTATPGFIDDDVAVGRPPVPPPTAASAPSLDDEGNMVAVGAPPIPPAVDDDGNAVAVGQPPVPVVPTDDDTDTDPDEDPPGDGDTEPDAEVDAPDPVEPGSHESDDDESDDDRSDDDDDDEDDESDDDESDDDRSDDDDDEDDEDDDEDDDDESDDDEDD